MIYLFITYIIFSVFLIIRNYRTKNIIWLSTMLIGFCLAFFGLAFYTEYLSSSYHANNKLFNHISNYIWRINYYLKLDLFSQYRIMNIGTAIYIYGAICFPISFINNKKVKYLGYLFLAGIPALLMFIFDPTILKALYKIDAMYIFTGYVNSKRYIKIDNNIRLLSVVFNVLIKIYLISSIVILLYQQRKIIPIMRKKFNYMIIGIIPIHILFLVLFYWFPNHKIIFHRYGSLSKISLPYNEILYIGIISMAAISIILLLYAILKYNIFEINVRKSQIDFERQLHTAHIGGRIFSHSIKNQLVAIRLLAEQLKIKTNNQHEEVNSENINEIIGICNNTIEKISSLSKSMSKVKLNYNCININKFVGKVVNKHQKLNPNIKFKIMNKQDIILNIDRQEFKRVLTNIIINSIEACINVKTPEINIIIDEQYDYGVIEFIDNGCGIEHKNIEKIFQPFYSTKTTVANWGVGLAYCQKVIEAFGGVIDIESEINQGTNLKIYIPNTRR